MGTYSSTLTPKRWKCLLCDYTMGQHQWYQVFGHAAATHGYTSRAPGERLGIQIRDKYSNEPENDPPDELMPYVAAEIDNRRIQIRIGENNEIRSECGYCRKHYAKEKGITTHIGKMRNETKTRGLIFPNFPTTFYNLANLEQHMLNKSGANKQQGTMPVPWEDIAEHNQTQGEPHVMIRKTTGAEGPSGGWNSSSEESTYRIKLKALSGVVTCATRQLIQNKSYETTLLQCTARRTPV